ncbi:venom metalloproteinase antarease-like TtrivMP_A isoform X1 [Centruroides sculpturatus]|uniref:venom metalloproteinase antarease-like TtrivMP_A isoform X1 n=1 Tax=Centruroides sculpturatus TaxID=218467 RepID=UPI000C6EF77F|nr:venom metalloproteinase antarease-like TtrivMP_A isoform X1 [Centruroides sculpturatus]XP_023228629.1 venom metalloproteinase antarease-like TtrivMP_A isoform X1 [Centruroides sculpturatus]
MNAYVRSLLFFLAVSAIPTGREEIVYPSLETSRSGVKTVSFKAFGHDINLRLESAGDILADDFAVYDGEGRKIGGSVESLRSKIYRDSEKEAALHVDEEGPLSVKGIVSSNLRIEPCESEEMIRDGVKAHRIIELKRDEGGRIRTNDALMIPQAENATGEA